VGLYGVVAYVVGLRSREIAIRIALGLHPARAARMMVAHGEIIVLCGAVVGLGIFVGFAKLLRGLAFEVPAADPISLLAAGATVLAVATLATWIPARRAARIDPASVLKGE